MYFGLVVVMMVRFPPPSRISRTGSHFFKQIFHWFCFPPALLG